MPTVNAHLKGIFAEGELPEASVVRKHLITATNGKNYKTEFYSLDVVLAVGYRVRTQRGTQFRQWATEHLREYLIKGFVMDDARLKEGTPRGIDYFDELLERIRDIRSSEKVFYRILLRDHGLKPALPGDAHGMAGWVDRQRLAGNGVCPLAAALAFRTLSAVLMEHPGSPAPA